MILCQHTYRNTVDFVSQQNPHIRKIANKFMNALGINYFGLSHIASPHNNTVSLLNTDVLPAIYWAEKGLPLPITLPNGFYFATQFKRLFPEHTLRILKEKHQRDFVLFNVQHGHDGTNIAVLAGDPENKSVISNYLNHAQTILDFQYYFLQETKKLRKDSKKYALKYDLNIALQKKILPQKIITASYNGFSSMHEIIDIISPREFECLKLRTKIMSLKAIAQKLTLSESTVEGYLDSAKDKLNCSSRDELLDLYNALLLESKQHPITF